MTETYEQQPFDPGPFIDNPGQRCPCLLLLDVSGSMSGNPIRELNAGVVLLKDELSADPLASKRVQIAVVTFGPVETVTDFVDAGHWVAPALTAKGNTPMGAAIEKPRYIWRNMIFRNLGAGLSSILICEALALTYFHWAWRYGSLPLERLRSEIDVRRVRSTNPGFCYLMAGWERGETRNGKLFLWAPSP